MASNIWYRWLNRMTKGFSQKTSRQLDSTRALPRLELLEDRTVPSANVGFDLPITGGSAAPNGVTTDSQGDVYVTGAFSSSATFNTTSGSPVTLTAQGVRDAFVAKYTSAGILLWAKDIGGSTTNTYNPPDSRANAIAVDSSGNVYVTGFTYCNDFPLTANAFQANFRGNADAFLVKLDPTGSLLYSSLLGGDGYSTDGNTSASAIAVDNSGHAYITGSSFSTSFPTTANAFQTSNPGGNKAIVAEFETTQSGASSLLYSSYLGGNGGDDAGYAIALHNGKVYVTGRPNSSNFPTTVNAYQPSYGGSFDGFVAVFDTSLLGSSSLLYSTYLGGSGFDASTTIAVDGSGNIYVAGVTSSVNFPTMNPLQSYQGTPSSEWVGGDAFVTELNPTGSALIYSTYLGGNSTDFALGLAVDASGMAYVTGWTTSSNFPTAQPLQASLVGSQDAFVTVVQPGGSGLSFSTYLGGSSGPANGNAIALGSAGNVYVVGQSSSNGFITQLTGFAQVLTAQQQIMLIEDRVTALVTANVLSCGNANALTTKLNAATSSLDRGNEKAGINQLRAFINQVNAFKNAGKLTNAIAHSLIDDADEAIASVV